MSQVKYVRFAFFFIVVQWHDWCVVYVTHIVHASS